MIEMGLRNPDITSARRRELEKKLEIGEVKREVVTEGQYMCFASASRILKEYTDKKEDKSLEKFYDTIQSSLNVGVEKLTKIYLRLDIPASHIFSDWVNRQSVSSDGEVSISTLSYDLEEFYIVKALSILAKMNEAGIEKISLPHNRNLVYLVEKNGKLIQLLDDIKKNPKKWSFVLGEEAISMIDPLRNLLYKAGENQKKFELRIKREISISQIKNKGVQK